MDYSTASWAIKPPAPKPQGLTITLSGPSGPTAPILLTDDKKVDQVTASLDSLKVTDEGYDAHIVLIVDESGSMANLRDSTISGVNEILQSHRNKNETFTLVKFNSYGNTRFVYFKVPISKVPEFATYTPDGGTALSDAVGHTVKKLTTTPNGSPYELSGVFMRVFTDGEENESRDFTNAQLKTLFDKYKQHPYDWDVAYIGCNMNTALEKTQAAAATQSGFAFSSAPATKAGVSAAYRQVSQTSESYSAFRSAARAQSNAPPIQQTNLGATRTMSSAQPVNLSAGNGASAFRTPTRSTTLAPDYTTH